MTLVLDRHLVGRAIKKNMHDARIALTMVIMIIVHNRKFTDDHQPHNLETFAGLRMPSAYAIHISKTFRP